MPFVSGLLVVLYLCVDSGSSGKGCSMNGIKTPYCTWEELRVKALQRLQQEQAQRARDGREVFDLEMLAFALVVMVAVAESAESHVELLQDLVDHLHEQKRE